MDAVPAHWSSTEWPSGTTASWGSKVNESAANKKCTKWLILMHCKKINAIYIIKGINVCFFNIIYAIMYRYVFLIDSILYRFTEED